MSAVHQLPVRVYYEDTDFSGVVYHASYLRFMERGRTELIRALGVEQRELFDGDAALGFAVRHMAIDFLRPAVMDDMLTIETRSRRGARRDHGCRAARAARRRRCWSRRRSRSPASAAAGRGGFPMGCGGGSGSRTDPSDAPGPGIDAARERHVSAVT